MDERISCRTLVEEELTLAGWSLCDEGCGYVFPYAGHECIALLETVSPGKGDALILHVQISTMLSPERMLGSDDFFRRCNGKRISVIHISVEYDDKGDARLVVLFRCFAFLGYTDTAIGICAVTPFMELLDSCEMRREIPERHVLQFFSIDRTTHTLQ